mmetsp:Transcript_18951/g.42106  ORF Transcript_18951/g.42106 Transcript_18951/m.42106 type:complete len:438 (+) Transcript_18951:137-1450(+)
MKTTTAFSKSRGRSSCSLSILKPVPIGIVALAACSTLLPFSLAFVPSNLATNAYSHDAFSISAVATSATDVEFSSASAISPTTKTGELDWSFVDAVYLITCPNADPDSVRLENTKTILSNLGLMDRVEIKRFETDDEDRIRGCYTSHIAVMKDAMAKIEQEPSGGAEKSLQGDWWQQLSTFMDPNSSLELGGKSANQSRGDRQARVLVLEDNLDTSGNLEQSTLDAMSAFAAKPDTSWDMIHLSYIPYVPNLLVSKTKDSKVVKLSCGVGSALGTTAYIINENGMRSLINEHEKKGYYAAIPDVMALRFPESRYASNPVPFLRAPKTPSLVNPQLDDLRSILFQPGVVSSVQSVLATTGLSSNNLLFTTIGSLLGVSGIAGKTTFDAGCQLASTGAYDGNIILPLLSSTFSLFSLGIIGVGAALAPKPPEEDGPEEA